MAATTDSGSGNAPAVTRTCTGDHQMLQARDGSGWHHSGEATMAHPGSGQGHQQMSGALDGTGPRADRPMDGTGHQWGSSS
ncbi:hypothetical protein K6U06_12740 [Acidiferrimicrobium sp. IK]|uniref:hypothetical protein n=1 Tax=Acidiferrimicrobium sp. IK TaxID=2871700 RepID=UPI0021CB4DF7|nr:hypothetical protein [Acidiferrimicrobium sp. IK]MCU4185233.1 hypothetical protein [Acidiferrimicrobium sp. IK]